MGKHRSLKLFREQAGMTQEELADKLNITQSCVSKYENGRKEIDVNTFATWAKVTNCDAQAAIVMFGTDIFSNLATFLQVVPMFIGGFI